MSTTPSSTVVIGAGPYGLAAAAHLRAAGLPVRVFGEVMAFWRRCMPAGMRLRSSWDASHLADPGHALTLDAFGAAEGRALPRPLPLDDFVDYGHWFARRAVPEVDPRRVVEVAPAEPGFRVRLADDESLRAARVVVATGIEPFAAIPAQFEGVPSCLASHSTAHADLGRFAGRRVAVVGGGQSAFECAALLHEAGASVEILLRAPKVNWLKRSAFLHTRLGPVSRLLYRPSDVGPPGLSLICDMPMLWRALPLALRRRVANRAIRPAASSWLEPRLRDVRVSPGRQVRRVGLQGDSLRLTLDDGTDRTVDHALLATGYRIDVARYGFLSPAILDRLNRVGGYPVLTDGFASSVRGLHFLGASGAESFGPLLRFVSGSGYAARSLTGAVLRDESRQTGTALAVSRRSVAGLPGVDPR